MPGFLPAVNSSSRSERSSGVPVPSRRRTGHAAPSSTASALLLQQQQSQSQLGAPVAEQQTYKSFALYCDVKLRELRRGSAHAERDPEVATLCLDLLQQATGLCSASLRLPLRSIAAELEACVMSDQLSVRASSGGGGGGGGGGAPQRAPYFQLVAELQDENRRLQEQYAARSANGALVQAQGTLRAKREVDSRLLHLESELSMLQKRLVTFEGRCGALTQQLGAKHKECRQLEDQCSSAAQRHGEVRRELAMEQRQRADIKAERDELRFDEGLLGAAQAREGFTALAAERSEMAAKVAASNRAKQESLQEQARLSYRHQQLKRSLLSMVPLGEVSEVQERCDEMGSQLAASTAECESLRGELARLHAANASRKKAQQHLTPRPNWSAAPDFLPGSVHNVSSVQLGKRLFATLAELRGIADVKDADKKIQSDVKAAAFACEGPLAALDFLRFDAVSVPKRILHSAELVELCHMVLKSKVDMEIKRNGRCVELDKSVGDFLRTREASVSKVAETGYAFWEGLASNYDPVCIMFKTVLEGRLDEDVLRASLALPAKLMSVLAAADREAEGKLTLRMSKRGILNAIRLSFYGKTRIDLIRLRKTLDAETKEEVVHYQPMLEYNLEQGIRSEFVREMQTQLVENRAAFCHDIQTNLDLILSQNSPEVGDSTVVAFEQLKKAVLEVDPDRLPKDASLLAAQGFVSVPDFENTPRGELTIRRVQLLRDLGRSAMLERVGRKKAIERKLRKAVLRTLKGGGSGGAAVTPF